MRRLTALTSLIVLAAACRAPSASSNANNPQEPWTAPTPPADVSHGEAAVGASGSPAPIDPRAPQPSGSHRLRVRFEAMLHAGLLEEVRALHARGDLTPQHPSMRAVGYRQLWAHCTGAISLAEASQKAVAATAQLAKRQMTWLRREREVTLLGDMSVGDLEALAAQISAAAYA